MHDDNTAMIAVFKTGRNPTMRTLGRTHGVSIRAMHEATVSPDFELGPIGSGSMVADGHTKAFTDERKEEWNNVRRNIGVYRQE